MTAFPPSDSADSADSFATNTHEEGLVLSRFDQWFNTAYPWVQKTLIWGGYRRPIQNRKDLITRMSMEVTYASEKQIYGYCKARAGSSGFKLIVEEEFASLLRPCRAEGYALLLADYILLLSSDRDDRTHTKTIDSAALDQWMGLYAELLQKMPAEFLRLIDQDTFIMHARRRLSVWWHRAPLEQAAHAPLEATHAPLGAADVVEQSANRIFDMLPIHSAVREHDFPMFRNTLMIALANLRTLSQRIIAPAHITSLLTPHR